MCNRAFNKFPVIISILLEGDEIHCYVHDVTQHNQNGKVHYSMCKLQTVENEMQKAICFSPPKVSPLKRAMDAHSPVKITKYDYNERYNNIVIKNSTIVKQLRDELDFEMMKADNEQLTQITSIKSLAPQQLVSFKATVKNLSAIKTFSTDKGSFKKTSASFVDPTGSINAVFWEEWVSLEEEAKSGFSLDETENFQQELPEVEPSVSEMATNRALVSVIGVKQFNKFFSCTSCSQKLVGQGELMKCDGCKLIQKCDASKITYFARLFIKDEDKSDSKFFVNIFHQQIMSIVNKSEDCPDDLTEMQFTEFMLQHEPFEVAYNSADSKVTDIY
eukprot:gene4348-4927_t